MKIKFFTNKKILLAGIFVLAAVTEAIMFAPAKLTAHAALSGHSNHLTPAQLHTATLASSVSSDTPTITFLTHGLGGSAGDWSNGMHRDSNGVWQTTEEVIVNGVTTTRSLESFRLDSNSIIEKIRNNTQNGIKLYVAHSLTASSFILDEYALNNQNSPTQYVSNLDISPINDFSQHTVVVFDIPDTYRTMEQLYGDIHYAIDKISYDYFVWSGSLPRINLIGHSLGGLINMNYAIAHPKNVASLISLGTPYNGSWYDNWFAEMLGVDDFNTTAGKCITGECGHNYYFCNLTTRKNTWNSTYAQNLHLNFYALSGTTSLELMNHIVWDNMYLETHLSTGAAVVVRGAYLASPLVLNLALGILPGDVCVDTNSQQANGWDGVISGGSANKNFTTSNSNVNKRSQNHLPVPHNLETYDADLHNYILSNVTFGSPFNTTPIGLSEIRIDGANITFKTLTIPDFINGRAVTSIGANAFLNRAALTCVSVPFKVETIGNNAFAGCINLTIRAEAASKPGGWSAGFNPLNRPVSFGGCCVCNGLIGVSGDSHAADCASCGRHVEREHGFTCEHLDDTYHAVNCECGETWQEVHSYRHVSTVSFGIRWKHTYQCSLCVHTMIIIDDTPAIIVFDFEDIAA